MDFLFRRIQKLQSKSYLDSALVKFFRYTLFDIYLETKTFQQHHNANLPLVADEHNDHIAVTVLPRILQPGGKVVESLTPCDVIHKQCAGGATVVRPCDATESFLASSVPDLQLDLLSVYCDHASAKLHTW